MIFADKLILLRKKAGWSQEELAEQMNVTRQSVSKWEGAQSVPDLDKMIRLSELFGVSTDYLLKDEIEQAEHINSSNDMPSLKRVSMEEANAFLSVKSRTAKTIAYAAFLCILSPIALLILGAISESTSGGLSEDIAGGIGMIALIIFVAIAAVMFISSGSKTAPFAYLEKEKFEKLLPIARKYGAMFILLPLSDEGLPKSLEEKREIVNIILDRALELGFAREDIVVDGLVATVGANPLAALECYDTISYCKNELGLATICGLSNISFGLPDRQYVNTAFLTMAIANGLTMAIANPSQELLMNAAFATDMLLHKDGSDIRYINRMNLLDEKVTKEDASGSGVKEEKAPKNPVFDAVLHGNKGGILGEVKKELDAGKVPDTIISEDLIPAINEVGVLFDKQIYFRPQLIASANAMKMAIEYLEPMLVRDGSEEEMATIVMATVEGDIHDIGKNLVVLMLKNYGYRVLDLGKDVAASIIVDTALKENAKVIGLSALMTTTMMRMKDVVELAQEKEYKGKIIIGGAAITPSFADEIGADGYSKDAAECVKLVERLLAE